MRRGYTLIEMMIVVAMLGIIGAGSWSVWSLLSGPGSPGDRALDADRATIALMSAHQEALLTPLGDAVGRPPAEVGGPGKLSVTRAVERAAPGLLQVTLEARWVDRRRPRSRRLVVLKAEDGP